MGKSKSPSTVFLPEPPEWLLGNAVAVAEWQRMLSLNTGFSDPARAALVGSYCLNYARWRAAEEAIEADGTEVVLRDDKGVVRTVIPSVQIGVSVKYHDRMLKSLAALGVSAGGKQAGGDVSAGLESFTMTGLSS